jgi:hypothetical protein
MNEIKKIKSESEGAGKRRGEGKEKGRGGGKREAEVCEGGVEDREKKSCRRIKRYVSFMHRE